MDWLLLSQVLLLLFMLPFFLRFEKGSASAEKILIIAIISALSAVSRVPFSTIPSVQPVTFIVIMTALVFGGQYGFLVGALSALVSNIFLGQGPWTIWQMASWGMIGLLTSWLPGFVKRNKALLCVYAFSCGYIFSIFMNVYHCLSSMRQLNLPLFLAAMLASSPLDFMHGAFNVVLIWLLCDKWTFIFTKVRQRYNITS